MISVFREQRGDDYRNKNHHPKGNCPNEFETSYAPDRPELRGGVTMRRLLDLRVAHTDVTMPGMKSKKEKIVHYDREADVLAIYLGKGGTEELAEIAPGVSVEYGKDGNVMGIEILNASRVLEAFLASHAKRAAAHVRS
jgi:uncharacterized protein YuzE